MTPIWRAFRIEGGAAAEALDWLHVHAEVQGAVEEEGAVTVWLDGDLPQLPFAGLRVHELASADANQQSTGLEQDRVIDVAPDLWVRPPWVQAPAGRTGIELVVPRGNVGRCAKICGLSRRSISSKIAEYDIKKDEWKEPS